MSTQFRLKDDWKPVGGSKAAKKLADWMNAISKQLNRAQVVSGGTARPTDLGFRIEVDGLGNFPFQLSDVPSAIRVRTGTVQRNGTDVTLVADALKEYKSITTLAGGGAFGASATYKVYGILDNGVTPTTLTVAAAAALPTDDSRNLYFEIGEATTNADSEISGVTQTWWGGNRDDVSGATTPDAVLATGAAEPTYTIDLGPENQLVLYGVNDDALYGGQDWDFDTNTGWALPMLYKGGGLAELRWLALDSDYSTAPDPSDHEQKSIARIQEGTDAELLQIYWMDQNAVADVDPDECEFCYRTGKGLETRFGTMYWAGLTVGNSTTSDTATTISGDHAHENHVFTLDDHDGSAGGGAAIAAPAAYLLLNAEGTAMRNACAGIIGDVTGNPSIDPDGRLLTDGVNSTLDWFNRQLIGGHWEITDNTVASNEAGALEVSAGGIYAAAGIYSIKGESAQAGYYDDTVRNIKLADGVNAATASGNIKILSTSGVFGHNGQAGVTIANWGSGGILTGSSVVEKLVSELNPGDKILCISA